MKFGQIGLHRLLRVASALIVMGLIVEIISLLWFHPLSFVLFAFVGTAFIGLGIVVYLLSLLFISKPSVGDGG